MSADLNTSEEHPQVKRAFRHTLLAALPLVVACATRGEPPAVAHEHPTAATPAEHQHGGGPQPAPLLPATAGPGYTVADVRFMQDMIGHHAQALVMSALAPTNGAGQQLLRLAEKIDISQRDEIAMMKQWLTERGQAVPADGHAHHAMMPGMLTPEQLVQLQGARGRAFERLFLQFMIRHHTGALQMVETLFASPGAAQDSDIFRFVTDVDADQRDEIFVMQRMLDMLDANRGGETR